MLRLLIPSILFAFILVSLGSRTASAEQVTGCLTAQGAIKDLAIGDAPAKPCKASATQISLPLGLETFELLDDNGLPIGTVLNVESPGRVTVLVEFPFHPRAIILRSRTEFGVSFFQSEKPFELRAWFAQEDCVGTAYGEPTNVVRTRTPTVEAAFVGKDNLGATRLYVGEEVVTTVEVVVVSQLTEIGCDNFGVKPLDDWAPLILLDPDLLSTFPSPHTLVVP